jgi:hypothetical protein
MDVFAKLDDIDLLLNDGREADAIRALRDVLREVAGKAGVPTPPDPEIFPDAR